MGNTASSIKITIVNRIYPPQKGITGESANDLVKFLIDEYGFDVHVVHVDGKYGGGAGGHEPAGKVHMVKSFYNGKQKLVRLFGNLLEGYTLIKKAKSLNSDAVIFMTDPPLVSMWAAKLLGHSQKNILWSMDLFPDAFLSGKLTTEKNVFYKSIYKNTYQKPPDQVIALGPLQHQYLEEKYNKKYEPYILPCGVYEKVQSEEIPDWKKDDSKIYFGYVGNLGEAHSQEFLKEVILNIDPARHVVILSIYGVKAKAILKFAKNKPGVVILPHVPREQLSYIDIHIVSLHHEWVNVCVPSKAISAICAEATFLFHGSANCDNWEMLKDAGWLIDENQELGIQVKAFINSISRKELATKKKEAVIISDNLKQLVNNTFHKIANYIKTNC